MAYCRKTKVALMAARSSDFGSNAALGRFSLFWQLSSAMRVLRLSDTGAGEDLVCQDGRGAAGSAQPSPAIDQCVNGGSLGSLEVEYRGCKTRASLPLDAISRPWGIADRLP
jgi:hypothetical protein